MMDLGLPVSLIEVKQTWKKERPQTGWGFFASTRRCIPPPPSFAAIKALAAQGREPIVYLYSLDDGLGTVAPARVSARNFLG